MDKRVYWVWLQTVVGCGWAHTARLLRRFGDAEGVWQADEAALREAGLTGTVLKRAMHKTLDKAEKQLHLALAQAWEVWTPDMPEFPSTWKALSDLPLVIYATDTMPFPHRTRPMVTVIATRKISEKGRRVTGKLAAGLAAAGVTIVGDTIEGGDATAMMAVAAVGGAGVIVQPCALDVTYPRKTAHIRQAVLDAGGVVLSEFPAGTAVRKEHFRMRNRLLATLGDALIVTEANEGSGTVTVAEMASAAGHEVYAVPGDPATNAGCHRLIRDGAVLVQNGKQAAMELADRYPALDVQLVDEAESAYVSKQPAQPEKSKKQAPVPRYARQPVTPIVRPEPQPMPVVADLPPELSENAKCVATHLTASPQGLEELTEKTSLSLPQVMMALTELEVHGVAEKRAGSLYGRKG